MSRTGRLVLGFATAIGICALALAAPPVEHGFGGRTARIFDEQTMLKNWPAAETPGLDPARRAQAVPAVRDRQYKLTGKTLAPVAAARCSPDAPIFKLDFGTLDVGCYVVRVIAMARTEDIEKYRKPILLDFKVNDKVGGGTTWYRQRVPYWDTFYCVTDLYFNADEKRPYSATLTVGQGSQADLYIHNIELHDTLKGLAGVAAKIAPGFFTLAERESLRRNSKRADVLALVGKEVALDAYLVSQDPPLTGDARRKRDDLLWNCAPPVNMQYVAEYDESFVRPERLGALTPKELAEQSGAWELPAAQGRMWHVPFSLTNKKLGLNYSLDDLLNHRPLPQPYPYRDDGTGVLVPQTGEMKHPEQFMGVATAVGIWSEGARLPLAPYHGAEFNYRLPYLYHALGDERAARDAAFLLVRWAYAYPAFTDDQMLGYAVIAPASMYNRDMRLVQRRFGYQRPANLMTGLIYSYDYLYDYIRGNQELAQAVSRYLPWVKTDEDVRRLIETRMLQYAARQIMGWHRWNDKGTPGMLMEAALVQQDPKVTAPWMQWLWTSTWVYPYPSAGVPDYVSTTTQRDGTTNIGSVFYSWSGSPFREMAEQTDRYVRNGGDPRYNLADLGKYYKLAASCSFPLDSSVAGGYPMTIGDVGGPDKPRLFNLFRDFEGVFKAGYSWTADPRLAWIIKNYFGRRAETDAEWTALEAAAAKQERNPFLSQPSRLMANWAGILEAGQDSDDFRFKRAAYLRVGTGVGHSHADTLDLQMVAHGVRVLNDVGWRGEYSQPNAGDSVMHNLVEVNGAGGREGNWTGHAWIPVLAPTPGAQYMEGIALGPGGSVGNGLRTRAVAMIDADGGKPGARAPKPLPYSDATVCDADAVTPSTYLFDVQRVSGGNLHTFCFHGTYSDRFDVNVANKAAETPKEDEGYMRKWLRGDGMRFFGESADPVIATWRLRRTTEVINAFKRDAQKPEGVPVALRQNNAEQSMLGPNYRDSAPAKFTRLHLFGHGGERLLSAYFQPAEANVQVTWPFLMIQRKGANLESVYPSIIEPYAGEPFILSAREIEVPDNEADAQRAVAVEVKTRNGRTDLCLSDGRGVKARKVGGVAMTGRFAYVSTDDKGLRMAELVGGTSLVTPSGTLAVESAELKGGVEAVDYWKREVTLSTAWPTARLAGEVVELGNARHRTSFTIVSARAEGGKTVLTLDKAIDLSYAHVLKSDPAKRTVTVNVGPLETYPGMNAGLTCTSEDNAKAWKCSIIGRIDDGYVYQLVGNLTAQDFPVGSVLRLWEFGVGDEARLTCRAAVRRLADGTMAVETNATATWTPAK